MADFNDVIKAIKEASGENSKSLGSLETKVDDIFQQQKNPVASAADAEAARDAKFVQNVQLDMLKSIADSVSKSSQISKKQEKSGGFFAGIASTLGALTGSVGVGIGVGLKALAGGLVAMGAAGKVVLGGAGILAGVIGILAGVGVLTAKAFKSMAEDFKEGLIQLSDKEIDGDAVASNAKGLAAMGLAFGAAGVGAAFGALGKLGATIFNGINSFFGGDTTTLPVKELKEFGKEDLDPKGLVAKNAKAVVQFSGAMAAQGLTDGVKALSNIGANIINGINKFFGGETTNLKDTKQKIKNFGSEDIAKGAPFFKGNMDTIAAFYKAMRAIDADKSLTALTGLGAAIISGISKFFGGEARVPYAKIKEFAEQDISKFKAGIEKNLPTVLTFYNAMKDINVTKSGKGFSQLGGAIVGAITGLLSQDEIPFKEIKKFSKESLGSIEFAKHNVKIAAVFAEGMKELQGVQLPNKGIFASISSAISGFFGESTINDLRRFSDAKLNLENAKNNEQVVRHVAGGMRELKDLKYTNDAYRFIQQISHANFRKSMQALGNIKADNVTQVFSALRGAGLSNVKPPTDMRAIDSMTDDKGRDKNIKVDTSDVTISSSRGQNVKTMTVENLRVQVANIMDQRATAGGGNVASSTIVNQNQQDNRKTFTSGGGMRTVTDTTRTAITSAAGN